MGILEYILIGVIFGFILEHLGKFMDLSFTFWERIGLWVFWPIALLLVMYHFFKGLFE